MPFFEYGQNEIDYLKKKDKKLSAVIDRIGRIEREVIPDTFMAMVHSIVGQQISSKAAVTVFERLCVLVGDITPDAIMKQDADTIQQCGMSQRKAGYIKGIAEAALSKTVDFPTLHTLSDDAIIQALSSLHGVGVWTAEMLLIFSMGRPDVVSYGDLAIRRGIMRLYGLTELPKEKFLRYQKRYSPYGSVASLYLWALAAEEPAKPKAVVPKSSGKAKVKKQNRAESMNRNL